MSERKINGIKVFFILLVFIGLIVVGGLIYIKLTKGDITPLNQTQQINGSFNHTTNIYKNETVINKEYDFSGFAWFGIIFVIAGFIGYLIHLYIKYLKTHKPFTKANKDKCIKSALKDLNEQGYEISFQQPKQSYPYFGGDDERNPAWAFVFIDKTQNPYKSVNQIAVNNLISCCVNATTLETFNEGTGRDLKMLKHELHDQRFGKHGTPNWAVKTERPPSFEDLFGQSKPNVSFNINPDEVNEE